MTVSAATPLRGEVDRHLADGLDRVGVQRHAAPPRRRAASSAIGCTVPTSLLAHITVATATSSPSSAVGERRRARPGRRRRPAAR